MRIFLGLAVGSAVAGMAAATALPAKAYWVGGYYAPQPYYAPYDRPRVVFLQPPAYPPPAPQYEAPYYAPPAYAPTYAPVARPRVTRPRVVAARPAPRPRATPPVVAQPIAQPGRSPFEAAGLGPVSLSPPVPAIQPPPVAAAPRPPAPPPPGAPDKNVYPPEREYAPFTGD